MAKLVYEVVDRQAAEEMKRRIKEDYGWDGKVLP